MHDEDFDYTTAEWHADSVKRQIRVSNSRITGSFIIHMRKRGACNARDVRARDISFGRVHARPKGNRRSRCHPLVKGVGQNHACVISRAIVRTTDTLVSVRLPDCEIMLFKFLNTAPSIRFVSYSRKFWRNYFANALVKYQSFCFSDILKVRNNYTCGSIDFHSVLLFVESSYSSRRCN